MAAQKKADQVVTNNLKSHNQNLTNRNATVAVVNDKAVMDYISSQFNAIGLLPKGTNEYLQPYEIDLGKQITKATFLKVNGELLAVKKDYFPLPYSAQKTVAGMPAMALRERGVPWFMDVKDWVEDSLKNPNFDLDKRIKQEAARVTLKGATALFLYNSGADSNKFNFNNKDKSALSTVPVIYITSAGRKKYFNDKSEILDIELNVGFENARKKAFNITGYINNGAPADIIIAAPYSNFYDDREENINKKSYANDSVDVVSGTSILIELARMLTASKVKNNNYTFIAYSGQENRWLDNQANLVINLKRVGAYGEKEDLLIEGGAISDDWLQSVKPFADKTLAVNLDSTSRKHNALKYQVNLQILNFMTANTNDLDKELQNGDKINYEGELHIAKFIYRLVEATRSDGKSCLFR